jgi:hypothetical protein
MQSDYCQLYGGGLFALSFHGQEGVCALDREGDEITFRELLFPGDVEAAAQGCLVVLNAATALVRTPAFWHKELGQVVEDNVLVPGGVSFPKTEVEPYWGLSMD